MIEMVKNALHVDSNGHQRHHTQKLCLKTAKRNCTKTCFLHSYLHPG